MDNEKIVQGNMVLENLGEFTAQLSEGTSAWLTFPFMPVLSGPCKCEHSKLVLEMAVDSRSGLIHGGGDATFAGLAPHVSLGGRVGGGWFGAERCLARCWRPEPLTPLCVKPAGWAQTRGWHTFSVEASERSLVDSRGFAGHVISGAPPQGEEAPRVCGWWAGWAPADPNGQH